MKHCKRFLLWMLAALTLCGALAAPASAADRSESVTVALPGTGNPEIAFWLDADGVPYYRIDFAGETLVEPSRLGLNTSLGDLADGFVMGEVTYTAGDSTWSPLVGEQAEIRDCFQMASVPLTCGDVSLTLEIRAYATGVAFRYVLPQSAEEYQVIDEHTQFIFPAGTVASVHQGSSQTSPKEVAVESFADVTYQRPMTLQYGSGAALTICEANLDNYAAMTLTRDPTAARALKAEYVSYTPSRPAGTPGAGPEVTVRAGSPAATPWRTFVIGASAAQLPANSTIVQNLNEPADEETYAFSEWVEPGACLRAASGMNTTAIKDIVDQAADKGIRYVLLDTGWYGPEYDVNCDPRLDPSLLDPEIPSDRILLEQYLAREGEESFLPGGEGVFNTRGQGFDVYKELGTAGTFQTNVDIPAICDYANRNGVGIILYVNGVFFPDSSGRDRFDTDELFAKFESWGVKGVKPGFVNVRAQEYEYYLQQVIEAAARHRLVLTIHDEYVTTGIERTFPNLFCTEGIHGDEGIGRYETGNPEVAEDITTLFTRMIQGPADHTYCWPGKATKAYALASPLLFRSGMSALYWYTNPASVPAQDRDLMGFWEDFPGTWDESLYLEGSLYEYATYARRTGETWYIGSLSAVTRTLELPLDFLTPGTVYVAEIWADGADADAYAGWNSTEKAQQTLEYTRWLVTCDTVLMRELQYGFGYAVRLVPAGTEEQQTLPVYSGEVELLRGRLAKYQAYRAEDYTTDTYAVLAQAMEQAQAVLADPDAFTAQQIEELLARMDAAAAGLLTAKPLQDALAQVGRLTSYHYTAASWAVLEAAAADARALLEGSFSQRQLDEAAARIAEAIAGLQADPDAQLAGVTDLSDLAYTAQSWSVTEGSQGQIKTNLNRQNGKLSLMIDGEQVFFEKGMGLDAPGELYYNIAGMGFELFCGYVGVDAGKPDMGSITFRIFGDGDLLYESEPALTGAAEAQYFSVPVAGVRQLRLEADMIENRDGDWADWAGAQFLTYRDPAATLTGISVDGTPLAGFSADRTVYRYPVEPGDAVPQVEAICDSYIEVEVRQAQSLPGTATLCATRTDGTTQTFEVRFCYTDNMGYLGDLLTQNKVGILYNSLHYGTVYKNTDIKGGTIALTGPDGESEVVFAKGIGTHASSSTDSAVIFDIAGMGFERFESYVGIRYATHEEEAANGYRSSVIFRVYVDDEVTPRFESGVMHTRTPMEFVSVDITGAETLRLEVDACGDQSADHGSWGGAVFLRYRDYCTVTFRNGETVYRTDTVDEGSRVASPADPARDGEVFLGWFTDPACGSRYDFTAPVTADTELYAGFARLEINLLPGASVRLQEPAGLRFESVIDAAMYEALTAAGYTVTFGTCIFPADQYTGTLPDKVLQSTFDSVDGLSLQNGQYTCYTSIVNLFDQNYARRFGAVSYITVSRNGQTQTCYTSYDPADNARSVYEVACKVAQTGELAGLTEAQQAVITHYLDAVVTIENGAMVQFPGYSAPYEVTLTETTLTVTATDEGHVSDIRAVILNGMLYTSGWITENGVLTAPLGVPGTVPQATI